VKVSVIILLLMTLTALAAPFLANDRSFSSLLSPPIPYHPNSTDSDAILTPPNRSHLLGTDDIGRDVLAQLIWGTRISLSVGLVAMSIALTLGIFLGGIAGYFGGIWDLLISRLIEIFSCFPTFFFILALLSFVGPSLLNLMIVIGGTSWPGIARLVRAEFFRLREEEFVKAASALGAGSFRILFRHLLPNIVRPLVVIASFGIAAAILGEASLSFLGFGVRPEDPSWGSLLASGEAYWDVAWWLTLAPGSAIFLTVTAFNLLGESFRNR